MKIVSKLNQAAVNHPPLRWVSPNSLASSASWFTPGFDASIQVFTMDFSIFPTDLGSTNR